MGILSWNEQKQFRSLIGKLLWVSDITRSDVANETRHLSTKGIQATYQDARKANKTLEKLKKKELVIKYKKLGDYKQISLAVYLDAAFKNGEERIKSVSGKVILM